MVLAAAPIFRVQRFSYSTPRLLIALSSIFFRPADLVRLFVTVWREPSGITVIGNSPPTRVRPQTSYLKSSHRIAVDGLLVAQMVETKTKPLTRWQQWLEHPERLLVRRIVSQLHLWLGAVAAAYLLLMSASGSAIVFHNELAGNSLIEWLVRLHTNLLTGTTGRSTAAVGAALQCFASLARLYGGLERDTGVVVSPSIGAAISRGSTGISIARSASGCFLSCFSGEFPDFILPFQILLTFCMPLTLEVDSRISSLIGYPTCTSVGSGGSPRLFGCFSGCSPPSLPLRGSSFAAAG